jgi:hypothetical protein
MRADGRLSDCSEQVEPGKVDPPLPLDATVVGPRSRGRRSPLDRSSSRSVRDV